MFNGKLCSEQIHLLHSFMVVWPWEGRHSFRSLCELRSFKLFLEHFLCARHYSKSFIHINSFNSHSQTGKFLLYSFVPICKRNWSIKRLHNLYKVTKPLIGRTKIGCLASGSVLLNIMLQLNLFAPFSATFHYAFYPSHSC